jgi:hypothetical protein
VKRLHYTAAELATSGKLWFTPAEAATIMACDENTVLDYCTREILRSLRPAGTRIRRIPRAELVRLGFLEEDAQAPVKPLRRAQ